jgi:hypothetical protein
LSVPAPGMVFLMHRGVDPVEVEALSAPALCVGQVPPFR